MAFKKKKKQVAKSKKGVQDCRYSWIQDEVVFYAFEFVTKARVAKLLATFGFCPVGPTTLPRFLSDKVFFQPGEK